MIPQIIHFVLPEIPSQAQIDTIQVASQVNQGYEIKVWQDPIPPDDFRLSGYWPRVNSGAQLADLVRLEVIFRYGGVYFDSDVRSISPMDALLMNSDFFVASEGGHTLTNAVFGATPRHHLLEKMILELERDEPDWRLAPNISTGPVFWAKTLESEVDLTIVPRKTFYPYNYNEDDISLVAGTLAVHQWDGSWTGTWARQPRYHPRRIVRGLIYRAARSHEQISTQARRTGRRVRYTLQTRNPKRDFQRTLDGLKFPLHGLESRQFPSIEGENCELLAAVIEPSTRSGDFVVDFMSRDIVTSLRLARSVSPFGRVGIVHGEGPGRDWMAKALELNPRVKNVSAGETTGDLDASLQLALKVKLPIALLRCEGISNLKNAIECLKDVLRIGTIELVVVTPDFQAGYLAATDVAIATEWLSAFGYIPTKTVVAELAFQDGPQTQILAFARPTDLGSPRLPTAE